AHNGTRRALLGGNSNSGTLSQWVEVPEYSVLNFWLYVNSDEVTPSAKFDTLTVKANDVTLATYSNLDKGEGYVKKSLDLGQFANKGPVKIEFTTNNDFSLRTVFAIDDVKLEDKIQPLNTSGSVALKINDDDDPDTDDVKEWTIPLPSRTLAPGQSTTWYVERCYDEVKARLWITETNKDNVLVPAVKARLYEGASCETADLDGELLLHPGDEPGDERHMLKAFRVYGSSSTQVITRGYGEIGSGCEVGKLGCTPDSGKLKGFYPTSNAVHNWVENSLDDYASFKISITGTRA
ncbi:hypothetical protein ACIHFC_36890, partial [Streptomyces sp. NPDC052013]